MLSMGASAHYNKKQGKKVNASCDNKKQICLYLYSVIWYSTLAWAVELLTGVRELAAHLHNNNKHHPG